MAYIYDIADTWAASGTTFTAIKMSVTDTASAAGSLLMDLQVGGVSRVNVNKSGHIKAVNRVLINSGASETGIQTDGADDILLKSANTFTAKAAANAFVVPSTSSFSFAASATATDTPDTILRRDAANTLAQRNGVNAQAFNLYNTYTDASNYERGRLSWVGNELRVGTEVLGTGTARSLGIYQGGTRYQIIGGGFTQFDQNIYMNAANIVTGNGASGFKIGTSTAQGLGFWNATPVARPTTAITAGAFVANTSGTVNDTATFDGYTLGQVVAALRQIGLLA